MNVRGEEGEIMYYLEPPVPGFTNMVVRREAVQSLCLADMQSRRADK
jgi:hypothetical protein